jgi:hypothetical protein
MNRAAGTNKVYFLRGHGNGILDCVITKTQVCFQVAVRDLGASMHGR